MQFEFDGSQPLFQQIAQQISEAILTGSFPEGTQIPSTTEISKSFQINPATVLKGMNLLVEQQLLEKKRGIGMFVVSGAKARIQTQKREAFYQEQLYKLIHEARNLEISKEQLITWIERGYSDEQFKHSSNK